MLLIILGTKKKSISSAASVQKKLSCTRFNCSTPLEPSTHSSRSSASIRSAGTTSPKTFTRSWKLSGRKPWRSSRTLRSSDSTTSFKATKCLWAITISSVRRWTTSRVRRWTISQGAKRTWRKKWCEIISTWWVCISASGSSIISKFLQF